MVWFCNWFKSVLPWFVLFSALQLCALVCRFWCSPLPSLAWYALPNQQKTILAKSSKYFFCCWLGELNEVSKITTPNLRQSSSGVGRGDFRRWVSHLNSSPLLGKVFPELVWCHPWGRWTWPACGIVAFPYGDCQRIPCRGPQWLAWDYQNGQRQTPNPKLTAQEQALSFCSLNQIFILINRSKKWTLHLRIKVLGQHHLGLKLLFLGTFCSSSGTAENHKTW